MQIAVLGTGYVGLVCGTCLSSFGHSVTCVDTDSRKIQQLNRGRVPIFEPELYRLIAEQTRAGRLRFTTDLRTAVPSADVVFLAVGTPPGASGAADLSFIYQCARTVAMHLRGDTVIATKSTVPLGTGEEIEAIVRSEHPNGEWSVVSNPEFLREGAAIEDFTHPDRVIIGVEDARGRTIMERLYQPLHERGVPIVFTTRRTAELIKYSANAFLAAKIAFIGEIADLCEKSGANVEDVALGIGLDHRIGSKFLQVGPGYGGSCFPKDALALVATGRRFGSSPRIVEAVIAANEARKRSMVDKIMDGCGGTVRGKRIAVLGLAFKAGTDDMREAPSLVILPALEALGARVCACDPAAGRQARKLLPRIRIVSDPYECTRESDAVVILTEWDEFKRLDLERIKSGLRKPIIIDLRNIYRPGDMLRRGFNYSSVGRPPVGNSQVREPARSPISPHSGTESRGRPWHEDAVTDRTRDASASAPAAWSSPRGRNGRSVS